MMQLFPLRFCHSWNKAEAYPVMVVEFPAPGARDALGESARNTTTYKKEED